MSENQEQQPHFLNDTPVHVAVQSLQRQVEQLKRIINPEGIEINDNSDELQKEIKELRTANAKAEYRIQMLLRALEERDQKQ